MENSKVMFISDLTFCSKGDFNEKRLKNN